MALANLWLSGRESQAPGAAPTLDSLTDLATASSEAARMAAERARKLRAEAQKHAAQGDHEGAARLRYLAGLWQHESGRYAQDAQEALQEAQRARTPAAAAAFPPGGQSLPPLSATAQAPPMPPLPPVQGATAPYGALAQSRKEAQRNYLQLAEQAERLGLPKLADEYRRMAEAQAVEAEGYRGKAADQAFVQGVLAGEGRGAGIPPPISSKGELIWPKPPAAKEGPPIGWPEVAEWLRREGVSIKSPSEAGGKLGYEGIVVETEPPGTVYLGEEGREPFKIKPGQAFHIPGPGFRSHMRITTTPEGQVVFHMKGTGKAEQYYAEKRKEQAEREQAELEREAKKLGIKPEELARRRAAEKKQKAEDEALNKDIQAIATYAAYQEYLRSRNKKAARAAGRATAARLRMLVRMSGQTGGTGDQLIGLLRALAPSIGTWFNDESEFARRLGYAYQSQAERNRDAASTLSGLLPPNPELSQILNDIAESGHLTPEQKARITRYVTGAKFDDDSAKQMAMDALGQLRVLLAPPSEQDTTRLFDLFRRLLGGQAASKPRSKETSTARTPKQTAPPEGNVVGEFTW